MRIASRYNLCNDFDYVKVLHRFSLRLKNWPKYATRKFELCLRVLANLFLLMFSTKEIVLSLGHELDKTDKTDFTLTRCGGHMPILSSIGRSAAFVVSASASSILFVLKFYFQIFFMPFPFCKIGMLLSFKPFLCFRLYLKLKPICTPPRLM